MAKSQVGEESALGCQTTLKKQHSIQVAKSICSKAKPYAVVKDIAANNKDSSDDLFSTEKLDGCRNGNTLDLHGKGIKKLQKFEKLPGMKTLDLSCNSIEEIEYLDNHNEITELKLYGNNIRKIKNLDRLQELQVLQLQFNNITSLRKGLLKLRKLQRLRLDSNRLICMESRELSGLSQLASLDISHNQLTDITAVNMLPCLEELFASSNRLCGVIDLSKCNKLQELDLSNNKISEVRGLSLLETLTSVNLSGNVLHCTECLGSLCSLQELNLADNQLKSVSSFAQQFPNLEVLNVVKNDIDVREGLKSLTRCFHLVELNLIGNIAETSEEDETMHLMEVSYLMPQLEYLDGVPLNPSNSENQNSQVIQKTGLANASLESTQKIVSCLMDFESQMEDLQQSLAERFSQVKNLMASLPQKLPFKPSHTASTKLTSVPGYGSRPQTSCRSRSRIEEARSFAAQHFEK
ncbi:protein phosphatase 1 regulatory subunit 7-like isoform X1 [Chiloscyllium plagiosum]|uniref:protein phosphatase 1 regulatory subunit 7-like isoform X1 n=1 Tax=Chiloscyllium plagiosum TaxID=36176 RepID=UPI001CB7D0AF|nr:protein phosphatase 1 regulatory subunit 7-like isoform X1 [Chiloscyllium plagiosum]